MDLKSAFSKIAVELMEQTKILTELGADLNSFSLQIDGTGIDLSGNRKLQECLDKNLAILDRCSRNVWPSTSAVVVVAMETTTKSQSSPNDDSTVVKDELVECSSSSSNISMETADFVLPKYDAEFPFDYDFSKKSQQHGGWVVDDKAPMKLVVRRKVCQHVPYAKNGKRHYTRHNHSDFKKPAARGRPCVEMLLDEATSSSSSSSSTNQNNDHVMMESFMEICKEVKNLPVASKTTAHNRAGFLTGLTECPICNACVTYENVLQHMICKHDSTKQLNTIRSCPFCSTTRNSFHHLTRHVMWIHVSRW